MICFLDMDGVITDYAHAACEAHGIPYVYDNPDNHGTYWMDKIAGITGDAWQAPLDYDFWRNMKKTPEADDIVEACLESFDDVHILTTPSPNPDSLKAKIEWINEHYPMFSDKVMMGKCKSYLAGPDRILIDDFDVNVKMFTAAGGNVMLVPRPWNENMKLNPAAVPTWIKLYKEEYEYDLERV